jgi:hypothetical protein
VVLNFDPVERSLSLGVERSEADAGRIAETIVTYLDGCREPQTRVQIETHVEGKTKHKRTALKALCAAGRVSESGAGAKGDPFRYQPSNKTNTGDAFNQLVDSCSDICVGTREQASRSEPEGHIKTEQMLVPASPGYSVVPPANREQEEPFDEGEL